MKKLQNNFTTPEQSKRLLELGVPADSADMLWDGNLDADDGWEFEPFPTYENKPFSYYQSLYRETDAIKILPCWSVGRLIEILMICHRTLIPQEIVIAYKDCNLKYLIKVFELAIYSIDFSKLEE